MQTLMKMNKSKISRLPWQNNVKQKISWNIYTQCHNKSNNKGMKEIGKNASVLTNIHTASIRTT